MVEEEALERLVEYKNEPKENNIKPTYTGYIRFIILRYGGPKVLQTYKLELDQFRKSHKKSVLEFHGQFSKLVQCLKWIYKYLKDSKTVSEDTIIERYFKALPIHWQQQLICDNIEEGSLISMQMTALTLKRMESLKKTTEWPKGQRFDSHNDRKSHDGEKNVYKKKTFINQNQKKSWCGICKTTDHSYWSCEKNPKNKEKTIKGKGKQRQKEKPVYLAESSQTKRYEDINPTNEDAYNVNWIVPEEVVIKKQSIVNPVNQYELAKKIIMTIPFHFHNSK